MSSVVKRDGKKHELEDSMPSFFLAETMKYLIMLFGGGENFLGRMNKRYGGYVFTTEAHIFPISPSVVMSAHKEVDGKVHRNRINIGSPSSSSKQFANPIAKKTNVSSMICPASWTAFFI